MRGHWGTGVGNRAVAGGHGPSITKGEPGAHRGVGVEHPAHRMPVQGTGEVQQARALGDDRRAPVRQRRHVGAQGRVRGERGCVFLGEATTDDQPVAAARQGLVTQRVDSDHLGSRGQQQLDLFGVAKGERRPARDRDPRRPVRRRRRCRCRCRGGDHGGDGGGRRPGPHAQRRC